MALLARGQVPDKVKGQKPLADTDAEICRNALRKCRHAENWRHAGRIAEIAEVQKC